MVWSATSEFASVSKITRSRNCCYRNWNLNNNDHWKVRALCFYSKCTTIEGKCTHSPLRALKPMRTISLWPKFAAALIEFNALLQTHTNKHKLSPVYQQPKPKPKTKVRENDRLRQFEQGEKESENQIFFSLFVAHTHTRRNSRSNSDFPRWSNVCVLHFTRFSMGFAAENHQHQSEQQCFHEFHRIVLPTTSNVSWTKIKNL